MYTRDRNFPIINDDLEIVKLNMTNYTWKVFSQNEHYETQFSCHGSKLDKAENRSYEVCESKLKIKYQKNMEYPYG